MTHPGVALMTDPGVALRAHPGAELGTGPGGCAIGARGPQWKGGSRWSFPGVNEESPVGPRFILSRLRRCPAAVMGVSSLSQNARRHPPFTLGEDRRHPMKRCLAPLIALTAGSAVLLTGHSALAHGAADGGALSGLSHPLLGLDHLFMLMAVGTAASFMSSQLLLWALAGAVLGAVAGFSGFSLAAAEVMAALAIAVVGALTLLAGRLTKTSNSGTITAISGGVVAAGMAIHAMLHGLEAPRDSSTALWWGGALLSSALVCGGTTLLLKKLPFSWTRATAIACVVIGALLAFAPLGLLAGGAVT